MVDHDTLQPSAAQRLFELPVLQACVRSHRHPACNAYVPCHAWPVSHYNNFRHYLIIVTTLGKENVIETKMYVLISLKRLSETLIILWGNEGDLVKIYNAVYVKYPLFMLDFNETWSFLTDFLKFHKYRISWKSVQRKPSFSTWKDRESDRHYEANTRFLKFCKRAKNQLDLLQKTKVRKNILTFLNPYLANVENSVSS